MKTHRMLVVLLLVLALFIFTGSDCDDKKSSSNPSPPPTNTSTGTGSATSTGTTGTGSATGTFTGTGTGSSTGSDDHGNDADHSTLIIVDGAVLPGVIETASDEDWFRFSAESGVQYVLETHGSLDTIMYLRNTDGITAISSDDDSGDGTCSKITWTCSVSGTYYVDIKSYGAATGSYQFSIVSSGSSSSEETVKIYATADAMVIEGSSYGDTNFGSYNQLQVARAEDTLTDRMCFLYFPLSSIPLGSEVVSASICLRTQGASSTFSMDVHLSRCMSSWSESSITWNNKPYTAFYTLETTSVTWGFNTTLYSWDAKDLLQDLIDGSYENQGFALEAVGGATGEVGVLGSRETSPLSGDPDYFKPYLEVTYIIE